MEKVLPRCRGGWAHDSPCMQLISLTRLTRIHFTVMLSKNMHFTGMAAQRRHQLQVAAQRRHQLHVQRWPWRSACLQRSMCHTMPCMHVIVELCPTYGRLQLLLILLGPFVYICCLHACMHIYTSCFLLGSCWEKSSQAEDGCWWLEVWCLVTHAYIVHAYNHAAVMDFYIA